MVAERKLPTLMMTMMSSFEISLRATAKAAKTIQEYRNATLKLGRWLTFHSGLAIDDWADITKDHLNAYQDFLQNKATGCWCGKPKTHDEYACPKGRPIDVGYANNQYRGYQQFFRWFAEEEDLPNPMAGTKPPKIDPEAKVIPVIETADLAKLIRQREKGKDFESRRDTAMLRLFACMGGRRTELARLKIGDINLDTFEVTVTGKGKRQRIGKFDAKCAQALARYLRARLTQHKHGARYEALWLGTNSRPPLTPGGVYQVIERCGAKVDLHTFPHLFRHTFSHRWLDAGGAEGDLMELNGWSSPQMLRRYGRSARSARARRAYDRVNVMGDI